MAADRQHQDDQRWHQQHDYPSASHELDYRYDRYGDRSGGCA
jgi:hypothetical protein